MVHTVVDAECPTATLPSGAANEAAARDELLKVSGRPDHPPKRLRACPAALLGSHRADRSRRAPSVGQEGSPHLLLMGLRPVPMAALTLLRLVAPVLLWATYGSSARI